MDRYGQLWILRVRYLTLQLRWLLTGHLAQKRGGQNTSLKIDLSDLIF
jgi:hypothetical protein